MKREIKRISKEYHNLELDVHNILRYEIQHSQIKSKTVDTKCIKVNISGYTELAVINGDLVFLDNNGYQYSLYADCSLEDLIDILNQIY